MAYIGAEPVPGQNREVDDISSGFNGNATAFTLQVSSVNVSPESANNILINLGGVLQNPGTDYTIAASTITFTTAPAAGLSFFGIILGAGINTATVADDTIGPSKLIDTAVTAGSYTTADITVDAQGRITAAANGTIAEAEIANNAVTTNKIANDAVTFSKMQDTANGVRFLGKHDSGGGEIGEITAAQARTMINVADGANQTTINTNADNRIITGSGTANTLNGEANLTFDGNNLLLNSASGNVLFGETTAYNTFENGSTNPKLQVRGTNLNGSCQAWIRATGDAGAPKLFLANTRNTSSNGHTIVQSGDELGGLFFTGSDGSQFVNGASISAIVSGTPGADDVPGALVFGTNAGAAATTERMRIDSSGDMILGSSSSLGRLTVTKDQNNTSDGTFTNPHIRLNASNTTDTTGFTGIAYSVSTLTNYGWTAGAQRVSGGGTDGSFIFRHHSNSATGSDYVRINSNGNLQIGLSNYSTANPGQGNSTTGISLNGSTNGARIHASRDGAASLLLNRGSNSGDLAIFYFGGVQKGKISIDSSAVAYNTTTSDRATKKNFESWTEDVSTLFKNINPQKFNFNFQEDTDPKIKGFVAQDLVSSFPEAYNKGDDDLYQFNPSGMVVYLMKALQESVTKIETLETKVAALEAA